MADIHQENLSSNSESPLLSFEFTHNYFEVNDKDLIMLLNDPKCSLNLVEAFESLSEKFEDFSAEFFKGVWDKLSLRNFNYWIAPCQFEELMEELIMISRGDVEFNSDKINSLIFKCIEDSKEIIIRHNERRDRDIQIFWKAVGFIFFEAVSDSLDSTLFGTGFYEYKKCANPYRN